MSSSSPSSSHLGGQAPTCEKGSGKLLGIPPPMVSVPTNPRQHAFARAPLVRAYRCTRYLIDENLYTHRTRALLWRTLWAGIQIATILLALAISSPRPLLTSPAALSALLWLLRTSLWCALKWWSWLRLDSDRVPGHALAVTWRPFVIVYERPDVRSESGRRGARLDAAMDVLTGAWIGWAAALVNGLPGLCAPQSLLWWLHISLYAPHILAYNFVLASWLAERAGDWIIMPGDSGSGVHFFSAVNVPSFLPSSQPSGAVSNTAIGERASMGDKRKPLESYDPESLPQTRSYQQEMLEQSLRRNIIIALDTGSGKTHIAVLRLKHEMERRTNKISWFFAPTVGLCEQQRS
ncbi:hypothetical protein HDZ31DRAFT_78315, partial [Schizophyllum fasciatum]